MARITIGSRQGTASHLRNVRIKTRFSFLEERITWDTNKGAIQKRPGRERQQEKFVKDLPMMELLLNEYQGRYADAYLVLTRGWELATLPPVEVWMGDLILDTDTMTLYFSAKVESNNVATTCGFLVDTDPSFSSALTVAAAETPVTSTTTEKITANMDVALLGGLDLYVVPFGNDGNKIAYGIIKHIEIPLI